MSRVHNFKVNSLNIKQALLKLGHDSVNFNFDGISKEYIRTLY